MQYYCKNEKRRRAVSDHPTLNGIDHLEVSPDQKTLGVHFIHNLPGQPGGVPSSMELTKENVVVNGGVRVKNIVVESVKPSGKILTVNVNTPGDFSVYWLRLVASPTILSPPEGFDPILSEVEFSFKIECPSDFDCIADTVCPPEKLTEPLINYLSKDYASFRQLMLDRLSVIMPDWKERNPADLGIALVEVLAYAADYLSYYQDAVASEAYLGTARKRISVRRHARLLDYPIHDGCNARAWVSIEVTSCADGMELPKRTQFLTRVNASSASINQDVWGAELHSTPEVFESMHELVLYAAHNGMHFYTWGDELCCLPKGATRATLCDDAAKRLLLRAGDVLIFEERLGITKGKKADANPIHRHAARLTHVSPEAEMKTDSSQSRIPGPLHTDPLTGRAIVEIEWHSEDALPFPLCLWEVDDDAQPDRKEPVSIARGNVVLVDHGRTISGEELDEIPDSGSYRPQLHLGPLTHQGYVRDRMNQLMLDQENQPVLFDPKGPASAAFRWDIRDVQPSVKLIQDENNTLYWLPRPDLLNSDRFAREFVVEMEGDGVARLRFGDDVLGKKPTHNTTFKATYRIGNGNSGNVGAEAIAHIVTSGDGICTVRNPMPAEGGKEPEPNDLVRLYAPQAFRKQERAVTEADYAEVTQRHPEVQKAMGTLRWTGSWYTMFITVDRKGGKPVDTDFENELRDFLERFRLAGYDLEIDGPRFGPLDIAFTVCVAPGYFRSSVKKALLETFSNTDLPDGRRGFFHPDNFTFGQPVYLSQMVAAAMQTAGVQWVDFDDKPPKSNRFRRWGETSRCELDRGMIEMGRLEIARLDNDPNAPENGKIEFFMEGGLS